MSRPYTEYDPPIAANSYQSYSAQKPPQNLRPLPEQNKANQSYLQYDYEADSVVSSQFSHVPPSIQPTFMPQKSSGHGYGMRNQVQPNDSYNQVSPTTPFPPADSSIYDQYRDTTGRDGGYANNQTSQYADGYSSNQDSQYVENPQQKDYSQYYNQYQQQSYPQNTAYNSSSTLPAPQPYQDYNQQAYDPYQKNYEDHYKPSEETYRHEHDQYYNSNSQKYKPEPANRKLSTSSVGEEHPRSYSPIPTNKASRGRRVCCCFSTRRGCLICCSVFWILLLALIGIAVWYLFPQMPKVDSTPPVLDTRNGNPGYVVTGSPLTASATPFSVTFMLLSTITVLNNMRPDIPINSISVTGNLVKDGKDLKQISGAGVVRDLVFKSGVSKTFDAPFNITYTTNSTGAAIVTDEAFSYLLTSCGVLGGAKSDLKIKYTAVVDCPWISWIGIKPPISDTVSMACPLQTNVLSDVLKAVGVQLPKLG